jgi:hypothetical protein
MLSLMRVEEGLIAPPGHRFGELNALRDEN